MISDILKPTQSSRLRYRLEDFSRKEVMTPERMIRSSCSWQVMAIGAATDTFSMPFGMSAHRKALSCPLEVRSARLFCQAREKISFELLSYVLRGVTSRFEGAFPENTRWRRRRILAVDGTKINLQRSDELDAQVGRPTGGHLPQALVSTLANVSGKFLLDVAIALYASCERKSSSII